MSTLLLLILMPFSVHSIRFRQHSGSDVPKLPQAKYASRAELVAAYAKSNAMTRKQLAKFREGPHNLSLKQATKHDDDDHDHGPVVNQATYACENCGYEYDPLDDEGDFPLMFNNVKHRAFEDLPDTWKCPLCGVPKANFRRVEAADGTVLWTHDHNEEEMALANVKCAFRASDGTDCHEGFGKDCEHGRKRWAAMRGMGIDYRDVKVEFGKNCNELGFGENGHGWCMKDPKHSAMVMCEDNTLAGFIQDPTHWINPLHMADYAKDLHMSSTFQ